MLTLNFERGVFMHCVCKLKDEEDMAEKIKSHKQPMEWLVSSERVSSTGQIFRRVHVFIVHEPLAF